MGLIKGQIEFEKFKKGQPPTRKEAMEAECYVCNGEKEGGVDCEGYSCPMYSFMPYNPKKQKRQMSDEQRNKLLQNLKKARESKISEAV